MVGEYADTALLFWRIGLPDGRENPPWQERSARECSPWMWVYSVDNAEDEGEEAPRLANHSPISAAIEIHLECRSGELEMMEICPAYFFQAGKQ